MTAPDFASRLRELSAAASEAPWTDGIGDGCRSIDAGPFSEAVAEAVGQSPDLDRANAALIVALRNRADRIADVVEKARALRHYDDPTVLLKAAELAPLFAALDALEGDAP